MRTERTIMITGKEYQYIKDYLQNNQVYQYRTGTEFAPEILNVTDIYLDTDPDFTRNPRQFARVNDDLSVQVKIVYDDE